MRPTGWKTTCSPTASAGPQVGNRRAVGISKATIGRKTLKRPPNADPAKAESLRRPLVDKLLPLIHLLRIEQAISVRDIAAEIINTFDRFDVPATLSRWIDEEEQASQLERGREHEQVWANLIDLFDQMVDLLGDERMTPAEFNDVMESGLDRFDLALTPPTVDQVLVGQADRTRTGRPKAVFVLGMNEGEFPRPPGDRSILTDRDRRTLRQRRIDLDPGLQQRLLDERLIGYFALTALRSACSSVARSPMRKAALPSLRRSGEESSNCSRRFSEVSSPLTRRRNTSPRRGSSSRR